MDYRPPPHHLFVHPDVEPVNVGGLVVMLRSSFVCVPSEQVIMTARHAPLDNPSPQMDAAGPAQLSVKKNELLGVITSHPRNVAYWFQDQIFPRQECHPLRAAGGK